MESESPLRFRLFSDFSPPGSEQGLNRPIDSDPSQNKQPNVLMAF